MWYTRNILLFFSSTEHCTWAINSRKSSNLGSRAYSVHYCTGQQNYLLSNILRFALKICFWVDFYVMQLISVKIKWHIKWKYLIQIFHDICLSYYFKYLLNMFCYVKQVYEYCVCESTFIRGHQYSWYLQNALIHRLLYSWIHTLEVANQLKSFFRWISIFVVSVNHEIHEN